MAQNARWVLNRFRGLLPWLGATIVCFIAVVLVGSQVPEFAASVCSPGRVQYMAKGLAFFWLACGVLSVLYQVVDGVELLSDP